MITLIVGFPGSGKSYYAINKIYNILTNADKMSKDIDYVYTNINGVKFDFFPDSRIKFKKFDEADFYNYLIQLYTNYELNKNKDNVDDELIKISKEKGYHNALIVFDECHSFFDNQDKYKIFWLTYHRHLFHEIILLTQNKTLIHSKYRAIPEIFIEAQPRSKKIFNNSLSYKKYASFAMRKVDSFGKENIKTSQSVFNLYQSGNKSNQKSILRKYLNIIIIFIVLVFGGFYLILDSYKVPTEENIKKNQADVIQKNNTNQINNINKNLQNNNKNLVVKLLCDNRKGCIYKNNTYSLNYINKFINITKSKTLQKSFFYKDIIINHKIYYHFILTDINDLRNNFLDENIKNIYKNNKNYDLSSVTDKVQL